MNYPKKAIILCGGLGTRLRPLTYEIPKALLPVQGKNLTEHFIELLKKYDITEIFLAVGYMKDKIIDFFGDGSKHGVKIEYIKEEEALGTAGPLKLAELNETFLCANGDQVMNIDIKEMFKVHEKNKALATIALTKVEDPSHYGVAKLNGEMIEEFVEKPKREDAPSNLINAGMYIIEPEVIDLIPEGFAMLEKDIFPKLAEDGKLFGYPFNGQWFDTGDFERWERVIKQWKGL